MSEAVTGATSSILWPIAVKLRKGASPTGDGRDRVFKDAPSWQVRVEGQLTALSE
jgi:hypothetical protein